MTIGNDFYLYGFTRQDKGEEGAVFVRYDLQPAAEGKPEINETPLMYGGKGMRNYTLSIPLPPPPKITACVIVTRTSKKRYQAVAYDDCRIESFSSQMIGELRRIVSNFFAQSKNVW